MLFPTKALIVGTLLAVPKGVLCAPLAFKQLSTRDAPYALLTTRSTPSSASQSSAPGYPLSLKYITHDENVEPARKRLKTVEVQKDPYFNVKNIKLRDPKTVVDRTCQVTGCEEFDKTFETMSEQILHASNVHPIDVRMYCITGCGKDLAGTSLRLHLKAFCKNTDNIKMECPVEGCTKTFGTFSNLDRHLKGKEELSDPFHCPAVGCSYWEETWGKFQYHCTSNHAKSGTLAITKDPTQIFFKPSQ